MNKNQEIVVELLKDQELQKKLTVCKSAEECYELVKETSGMTLSIEEFKEAVKGVKMLISNVESGQLSEDDLEAIAGGGSGRDFVEGVATGAAIVGAIAAAAA